MTLTVQRAAKGIWCDYCKTRFPSKHPFHSKPASWTVISESHERRGMERHYCQACAETVSTWNDGTVWELQDQINYASQQERLGLDVESK